VLRSRDAKKRLVVDGTVGTDAAGVAGAPVFSADGKRIAWSRGEREAMQMTVDGVAGEKHYGIGAVAFSPDGKRVAYAAWLGSDWTLVVDGVAQEPVKNTIDFILFSPDGSSVMTLMSGKSFALNGKPVGTFSAVALPRFSTDSKSLSFYAVQGLDVWWKTVPAR